MYLIKLIFARTLFFSSFEATITGVATSPSFTTIPAGSAPAPANEPGRPPRGPHLPPPHASSRPSPYQIHQNLFGYKRRSSGATKGGAKKAKMKASRSHTFVCLHERDTEMVSTDYGMMTANGLEKAKLHLFKSNIAMEIHLAILPNCLK